MRRRYRGIKVALGKRICLSIGLVHEWQRAIYWVSGNTALHAEMISEMVPKMLSGREARSGRRGPGGTGRGAGASGGRRRGGWGRGAGSVCRRARKRRGKRNGSRGKCRGKRRGKKRGKKRGKQKASGSRITTNSHGNTVFFFFVSRFLSLFVSRWLSRFFHDFFHDFFDDFFHDFFHCCWFFFTVRTTVFGSRT